MSDVTAASIKLSDILAQGAGHVTGVAMNRVDVAGAIEISGVRAGNLTPLDAPKPATGAAPAAADPISILFLAANPLDMEPLRLDEECRAIDAALRQAEYRHFDLRPHWAVQVADLQELLLRRQPHILHFSGHGSDRNEIILQDASGQAAPVSAGALRTLFGLLKDNLRCVVLNACYTAEQAGAIADRIDCVVGMTEAISDPAARAFAVAFYRALGYGRTVQEAFDLGCSQIDLNNLDEADKPVLIAQHADPVTIRFVDPKA